MTASTASPRQVLSRGDRVFSRTAIASGSMILVILAAVAIFLIVQSLPAFVATGESASVLTTNFWDYVGPLVFGTVWAAVLALIIALPLSIGIALFISHYAPRKLSNVLGYLIDLLSAVPSVVYGLWGILVLAPAVRPFYVWLNDHASWIPLFGGTASGTGRTILTAAIVLAVMILPVMTAISREVFLQAPKLNEEAALALGATRWEMIRLSVLPFAKPGIISGAMLGLGRALGETMAVAMVLSASGIVSFKLLTADNPSTIAANIALTFPEAYGENVNVLIATGLILFIVTFLVNALARWIVSRQTARIGA
ncbi:phosphate ABC transporter membrane protein 1 (PhoT family) [Leucobacter komagatae]|uniref:Phosphate transport system permease protein n=1 Tax=Leucobacter komagatae TaxID=55969 RepID=A0A542Y6I4_9MICO|nr:phosphate ABC transporter permease subunit PstC [Leucobacter komagatae]TQL43676.1 phosphate ABC transporter membrane protein 1 (PhoT family) [Leucobacter komagatae]